MDKEKSREELLTEVASLRERQQELERERSGVKELKYEFLARMSHETRTPLNAIIGLSELTLKTELTPRQSNYLEKIRSSSVQLLGIISDLMDYIRIQAKDIKLNPVPFCPAALIESLAARLGSEKTSAEVDFSTKISSSLPKAVRGDRARFEQVLEQLLRNAFKFTAKGEVVLSAELLESAPGKVRLRFGVRDSGIGINPEQLEALFEPFTQVDVSMNRRYGGTGIGLALCRGIAGLMDSDIEAKSQPGEGSFFSLSAWLDLAKPEDLEQPGAPQSAPDPLSENFLAGRKILLVEDNAINQEVAGELLRAKGAQVELAEHGGLALQALQEQSFDAVLMDIQMPVMDGIEATQRIRDNPAWGKLPIIALTAHALDEDRKRCLEAGMNGYLTKPIDPSVLYSTLAEFLGSGQPGIVQASPAQALRSAQAPDSEVWPFSVPGIDPFQAVKRIGGNKQLFRKILGELLDGFADYPAQITKALQDGDRQTAVRLAHTIKGVAGNISAEPLAQISRELELSLANSEQVSPEELLAEFSLKLAEVLDSAKKLSRPRAKPPEKPAAKPLKILLVDDANINRVLFGQLLTGRGHSVVTAENGKDACRKIFVESKQDEPFDVILMDIEMPELDGVAATKMIRGILRSSAAPPCRQDIPIIALTSHEVEQRQQSFLDAGMDACVKKSFDGVELLAAIDKLVRERLDKPQPDGRLSQTCEPTACALPEGILPIMQKLAQQLINGELDAQDSAFELGQSLCDTSYGEPLALLERKVFSFDFAGALAILQKMASDMGGELSL